MTESVKREIKDVIDSVVAGDADKFRQSLGYLAKTGGEDFLTVTKELLKSEQAEYVSYFGFGAGHFYRSATHVLGAVYTPDHMLTSKANPSGFGLPIGVVEEIVGAVQVDYQARLITKVAGLESSIKQLLGLIEGSSVADKCVTHIAQTHFTTGVELLFGTLNPHKRA